MKLSPAIFLALGFAVSGAAPLYAADSSGHPQSPSSTSPGMTDGAQKNYQDALDNCNKKTGASKDGRATDMPGGAPMEGPTGGSSGQPGSQMSTPGGSPYGSPTGSPSGSSSGSPSGSTSGSGSY